MIEHVKKTRDEKTFVAEYRRIEADMRDRIRMGQWLAGAMLPSRRDLAHEYQVSSVTMNRALLPLLSDGTLRADDRRGTFISAKLGTGLIRPVAAPAAPWGVFGVVAAFETDQVTQDAVILRGIEQALREEGSTPTVCNRTEGFEHALLPLADAVQALLNRGVDALVLICLDLDLVELEKELSHIDFCGTPTVCILAGELRLSLPHIFYDNRIGGMQAAKYLLEKGLREITVVAPFTASWVAERVEGIRDACVQAGLPEDSLHLITGQAEPWEYQGVPIVSGYKATRAAIDAGWSPHGGIICLSDLVALGVNQAAAEEGCESGRDYAILGFDDHPAAEKAQLTTLRPPLEAMGREAVRLLHEEVGGRSHNHQLRLRAYLVPRASTSGQAGLEQSRSFPRETTA